MTPPLSDCLVLELPRTILEAAGERLRLTQQRVVLRRVTELARFESIYVNPLKRIYVKRTF